MATKASECDQTSAAILAAPNKMVQEYPLSSAMVVFGVGLGVGILAGCAVMDSMARISPPPSMTERLTRQLYDTLSQAVPESVSRRFAA